MGSLLNLEIVVIVPAYLLAAIPVGAIMLAGKMSPMYQVPRNKILCWWSWFALVIVVVAILQAVAERI